MNEICEVVSGEDFRRWLSFPGCFLVGGWNALCAIHKCAYKGVFMLGMMMGFEIKVLVGISSFPVNRHRDQAIFLSGRFGVEKGNETV